MDNQVNGPNWCSYINCISINRYIVYAAFRMFDWLSPGLSFILCALYSWLTSSYSVNVHMLVAGQTFEAHITFMQKLKPRLEQCSAENCKVILLFCPVVSRIGTDMEAAMSQVPGNKPVILVFMHHCHHPSHMTNITMEPARSNIVKVVHCAYHESSGLLPCPENEQAVAEVHSVLQRYKQRDRRSTEEACVKTSSVQPFSYLRF